MIPTLILAAGQSRRMGQLKQTLPWGDGILLGKTIEVYQRAGTHPILIVVGCNASKIKAKLGDHKVAWIENPYYQEGMASSIRAGVEELPKKTEAVLLALGDLPLIRPDTVKSIAKAFVPEKPNIVVPTYRERWGHPVLIPKEYFSKLLELNGDVGAKKVLHDNQEQIFYLNVNDPGICWDIDDPQTYQRLRPDKEVSHVSLD